MAKPILRQVLEFVEASPGEVSPALIATSLDLSPGQVESMLEFWIRKGRLHVVDPVQNCSGCGSSAACSFSLELPRTYRAGAIGESARLPCQ